jgi:hypothetical protein
MRSAYKVLVGKPERKRPHGRCKRRTEEDITGEMGLAGVDGKSSGSGYVTVVGSCRNRNEKSISIREGNFSTN